MMSRSREKAFNLIELLLVISIFSVLMAILLPAVQRMRTNAKRIVCQSNLKQITLTWYLYFDDYDGRLYRGRNVNYQFGGWVGCPFPKGDRILNSYLDVSPQADDRDEAAIFRCPSDQGGQDYDPFAATAFDYFGNSYQTNHLIIGPETPLNLTNREPWATLFPKINDVSPTIKRESIKQTDRLLFVGDHNWRNQWDPLNTGQCGRSWHKQVHTYNMAFFDGHVGFVRIQKGLFQTENYRLHPVMDLGLKVMELQESVPCVCLQD